MSLTAEAAAATSSPLSGYHVPAGLITDVLVVAVVLAAWFLLLVLVQYSTAPADVTAAAASADLAGDEPPAVVSLLVNRWTLNEDAAESTLIDLAARGWLEFRQPGNDPTHTTVHLLPRPASATSLPLMGYEQQVLDRVRSETVDDVVPLTALTFRDPGEAARWTATLHSAVIDDARARGLTQRRISPRLVSLLIAAAVVPAAVVAFLVATHPAAGDDDSLGAAIGAAVVVFALLGGLAGRKMGERDTPEGQAAAARWLGTKAFLRNDEAFAELPPAAVLVWDRYLSYGDALGVTRVCSALIDLGMGDRRRVWSSFGGGWHRVRIRYPRVWARYGMTPGSILLRSAASLLIGVFLLRQTSASIGVGAVFWNGRIGSDPLAVVGLLLAVRGVYRIARLAADAFAPRTLTGELLWVELWKSKAQGDDKPSVPLVHYFAVDDGTSDRTTAWAVPSPWADRARPGDVVSIMVRPWTRRITQLTVTSSRAQRLAGPAAPAPAAPAPAAPVTPQPAVVEAAAPVQLPGGVLAPVVVAAAAAAASGPGPVRLLSPQEVGVALGREVTSDGAAAQIRLGPFDLETFADPQRNTPVLVLATARGPAGRLVMRTLTGGTPLPGIGDEAWAGPGWAIGRRGEAMVRLNVEQGLAVQDGVLSELLARAVSRL